MFAERPFGAAVEPPAAIAPRMLDLCDAGAEVALGGRLEHVSLEQRERFGERAAGDDPSGCEVEAALEEHAVVVAAVPAATARRCRTVPEPPSRKQGAALPGVEGCQFAQGE